MTDARNESRAVVFTVPGDMLSTTAPLLRKQLADLLESDEVNALEIDLRAAAMVDSVGLNLLVWVWKTMKTRNGTLRLRILSPDIERILRFTRLNSYIEVIRESR